MQTIHLAHEGFTATLAACGGELLSWKTPGNEELIWQGREGFWSAHAPIMFPIIGQVDQGLIFVDGKPYSMPIPYGFIAQTDFEAVRREDSAVTLFASQNEKTLKAFPFAFRFFLTFRLHSNGLEIRFKLENPNNSGLPFSLGYHPGFSSRKSACHLEFERTESDRMRRIRLSTPYRLLIPEAFPSPLQAKKLQYHDEYFRDGAIIIEGIRSRWVEHVNAETRETLRMEFTGFSNFAIFSQPGGDFVCLEPWLGLPGIEGWSGDFRAKPGNAILEAGGSREWRIGLSLSQSSSAV